MKRLLASLAVTMIAVMSFIATSIPLSAAASPSVVRSYGGVGGGLTSLSFVVSPAKGDALVVFEFYGLAANPCNSIIVPSDSQSQTWANIGNCINDGGGGSAEQAFSVASYSSTVPTTISCNFAPANNHAAQSCYIFDVANPNALTLIASASGSTASSTFGNLANTGVFTAAPNSLIIASVGMEPLCQTGIIGYTGWFAAVPSRTCAHWDAQFTQSRGMSAMYHPVGASGETTDAPMYLPTSTVFTELVVQITAPTVTTTTTSNTATIIGWLAPDATHFSNNLLLMSLPLIGMSFFVTPLMMFKRKGDVAVYACLGGLLAGSILADLPANPNNASQIPFIFIGVSALLFFLWWWQN